MDGLSGAASVIGVVSLAVQLTESAKRLYDFWQSVQGAPENIKAISHDLKLLSTVLTKIAFEEQNHGLDSAMTDVLSTCSDRLGTLVAITERLKCGFESRSRRQLKWVSIKAVFKQDMIEDFQKSLERLKSTLNLAYQVSSNRSLDSRFAAQDQYLVQLTHGMESIQMQQTSQKLKLPDGSSVNEQVNAVQAEAKRMASTMTNPILRAGFERAVNKALDQFLEEHGSKDSSRGVNISSRKSVMGGHIRSGFRRQRKSSIRSSWYRTQNLFGQVLFHSRTYSVSSLISDGRQFGPIDDEIEETKISFKVVPAPWLVRCGLSALHVQLSQSTSTWKQLISTFRPVPFGSLIFEFSENGNIAGVRALLSRGEASVCDTDPVGQTALWYAASKGHVSLCKLLIDAGSDTSWRDFYGKSYLTASACAVKGGHTASEPLDLLRLFSHEVTFENLESDFYQLWWYRRAISHAAVCVASSLLLRMLVDENHDSVNNFVALLQGVIRNDAAESLEFLLHDNGDFTDRSEYLNEELLLRCFSFGAFECASFLLKMGADPHARRHPHLRNLISLTGIILYSSEGFFRWRDVFEKNGINLDEFVSRQFEVACYLEDEGWEPRTLLKLFYLEFIPIRLEDIFSQCDCCQCFACIPVEVAWQQFLDKVKRFDALDDFYERYAIQPPFSQAKADDDNPEGIFHADERPQVSSLQPHGNENLLPSPDQDESIHDSNGSGAGSYQEDFGWLCYKCWEVTKGRKPTPGVTTRGNRRGSLEEVCECYNDYESEGESDTHSETEAEDEDSPFLFSI